MVGHLPKRIFVPQANMVGRIVQRIIFGPASIIWLIIGDAEDDPATLPNQTYQAGHEGRDVINMLQNL